MLLVDPDRFARERLGVERRIRPRFAAQRR